MPVKRKLLCDVYINTKNNEKTFLKMKEYVCRDVYTKTEKSTGTRLGWYFALATN